MTREIFPSTAPFSLKEAAILSGLPEDRVRREVEHKVVEPLVVRHGSRHHLAFPDPDIVYFALVHHLRGAVELPRETRSRAHRLLRGAIPSGMRDRAEREGLSARLRRDWAEAVNGYVSVDWERLLEELAPRVELYRRGLGRLRRDGEVLGGEPVFEGTRISVRHVGGMRLRGEPTDRIVEDFPALSAEDVDFAALFAEANPLMGRPRSNGDHAEVDPAS